MFNVTDGRDINFGVDLLLLFSHFYLKSLDSPNVFNTDFSQINMLPHQTPGISNQALVFMRDVKIFTSRTDILVKSAIFDNTPAEKWFGPRFFFYLETFSKTWFLQLDIDFMVVQAFRMTFSSMSQMDKMLTLNPFSTGTGRTLYKVYGGFRISYGTG